MTTPSAHAAILRALGELAPEADLAALGPDADLRDALDLDSMDLMRLVAMLHADLGVDIPDTDTPRLLTLRSAEEYLARKPGL
jgi:acyl carrier protein